MSFKIVIRFSGDQNYRPYFEGAAARWLSVIKGPALTLTIDANVYPIDYPGGILAQAGPTQGIYFNGRLFPIYGVMTFDSYDLVALVLNGTIERVIMHEMGHVLGIGTLWNQYVVQTFTGPVFKGPESRKAYGTLTGQLPLDVPLENTGGSGTYGSHWRETVFDTELMTGYVDPVMPMSILTVACLRDLGYVVDYTKSEPFLIPRKISALAPARCQVELLSLSSSQCLHIEDFVKAVEHPDQRTLDFESKSLEEYIKEMTRDDENANKLEINGTDNVSTPNTLPGHVQGGRPTPMGKPVVIEITGTAQGETKKPDVCAFCKHDDKVLDNNDDITFDTSDVTQNESESDNNDTIVLPGLPINGIKDSEEKNQQENGSTESQEKEAPVTTPTGYY